MLGESGLPNLHRLRQQGLDVQIRAGLNSGEVVVRACRDAGVHCAIGINERESERPGSLYNTLLLLGPDGVELKHRKLVPTHQERLFHAFGAGDEGDSG